MLLSLLDGDEPGTVPRKLRAFGILLSLVVCTEYWTKGLRRWDDLAADEIAALVAVTLLTALVGHGRWRRAAFAGLALVQAWYVVRLFPMAGNHRYLELAFATALAFLDDEDGEERRVLLQGLRCMTLVVLFYAGLQKLVHGFWLDGQFLAWALWWEGFQTALRPLLPAAEFARLTACGWSAGDGPYRAATPVLALLSNGVWLAELSLAVLLVPRATRVGACVATCVTIVAAEVAARELLFGVEFIAAALLFLPGDTLRRMVLPLAAVLVALLLGRLGVLPEVGFH
jgi:hypothetical protein